MAASWGLPPGAHQNRCSDHRFPEALQVGDKRLARIEEIVGPLVEDGHCLVLIVGQFIGDRGSPAWPLKALVQVKEAQLGVERCAGAQGGKRQAVELTVESLKAQIPRSLQQESGLNGAIRVERVSKICGERQRRVDGRQLRINRDVLVEPFELEAEERAEATPAPRIACSVA